MHGHSIARDIAQRLGYWLHVTTLWPWELPSPGAWVSFVCMKAVSLEVLF